MANVAGLNLKGHRVVELSHDLFPGQEEYDLEVDNRFVEEFLPQYTRPPDAWYIMSDVRMWSHVGTHMESPYHYLKDREDVAAIPLARLVGEATLIDLSHKGIGEAITRSDMEVFDQDIRPGDIVFVFTGLGDNYRTPKAHDRPYFTEDAILWLCEKGIAMLGVDCSGIEKRDAPEQPAHRTLFSHGIPLIEHLAHLEQLRAKRFFVVAVPMRVHGLDASPVSVIAFEESSK
jgi:arylformamidase